MDTINSFKGEYKFLDNFYNSEVYYGGIKFKSVEAAFQASKRKEVYIRETFSEITPSRALMLGNTLTPYPEWDSKKDEIMYEIVRDKFFRNKELGEKLLQTDCAQLIKSNFWHDNYWGDCTCEKCKNIKGENRFGEILMKVRTELKEAVFLEKFFDLRRQKND